MSRYLFAAPSATRCIADYILDRRFYVRVGEAQSSSASASIGLPQGSLLGPLRFTVFINDLAVSVNYLCNLFADDVKIVGSPKNDPEQTNLDTLIAWSSWWGRH